MFLIGREIRKNSKNRTNHKNAHPGELGALLKTPKCVFKVNKL